MNRGRNGAVLAEKHKAEAQAFALAVRPALFKAMTTGPMNLSAVARKLNEQGVPSANGGKWYPQTVKRVLARLGPGFMDAVREARRNGISKEEAAFYAANQQLWGNCE